MFRQILIPIDLAHKEQVQSFLDASIRLVETTTEITLLYVDTMTEHAGTAPTLTKENKAEHKALAKKQLEEIREPFAEICQKAKIKVRYGSTYDQILQEAQEIKADAIILMAHRPDFSSYLLGTTAARVVRHANCSVFVLRE